jgi:hypothetical protein
MHIAPGLDASVIFIQIHRNMLPDFVVLPQRRNLLKRIPERAWVEGK